MHNIFTDPFPPTIFFCSVVESIPSAAVQLYALVLSDGGGMSAPSMLSIIISIATISFGTTTMCFDMDLDPERRAHTPDFYGYVPNDSKGRTTVFLSMFMFSACHIALRLLGVAFLAVVSPTITTAVLGGDQLLFLLVKLARNDLRYSLRFAEVMSWFTTLLVRALSKVLVDFTVMSHLRHPQEMGGVYWMACLGLGQLTSFVAVYLYTTSHPESSEPVASANELWALVGALEVSFIVCFAVFLGTIERKFVHTFFSTVTAIQYRIETFHDAKTDSGKMNILKMHPSYYKSIRGEVEQWVRENYEAWNEEQPEWFTAQVKRRIPQDMISKKELE